MKAKKNFDYYLAMYIPLVWLSLCFWSVYNHDLSRAGLLFMLVVYSAQNFDYEYPD